MMGKSLGRWACRAVAAVLLATVSPVQAQLRLGSHEIGFTAGGMNYIGDLNDQSMLGTVNLALGGFYRLNFDERWSLRVDIDYGHVEGGNPDYIARRNLSFRSYIFEGSLRMEFNFFPFSMREDHFFWTPYVFGGLGFFAFNPKAYFTDPLSGESGWYELQPLGTEGQGSLFMPERTPYTLKQMSMPFGIGVKYHPTKSLTLSAEYGFRKTWTDYIDDVSTTYVDHDLLTYYSGEICAGLADRSGEVEPGFVNAAGMKRGDDSLDDWFAYFNVSMSVSFDVLFGWMMKKKCDNK